MAKLDLDDAEPPGAECTRSVTSRTASKVSINGDCKLPNGHASTEMTIEVKSPHDFHESVRSDGKIDGHDVKTSGTFTAHWVSASCGTTK